MVWIVLDPWCGSRTHYYHDSIQRYPVESQDAWHHTPVYHLMEQAFHPPYPFQNDGITHLDSVSGYILTADLCPTRKGLDRDFIRWLINWGTEREYMPPLTLFLSGWWMVQHPNEVDWLKERVERAELFITWGQHSYAHNRRRDLPTHKNFLRVSGTDLRREIVRTEIQMYRNGLTPSLYFRFPGLVSDETLMHQLRSFCLIPIGSNAWLAKGEVPQTGSIILVHGNNEEPEGINRLKYFLTRDSGNPVVLSDIHKLLDFEGEISYISDSNQ